MERNWVKLTDSLIAQALKEDLGPGDVTTAATVPEEISYLSKGLSSAKNEFGNLPPESIRALINGACLVHGMISMEISGRLEPFIQDKAGFFDHQIRELIHRLGMETE